MEINLEEFITIKGISALGNQLTKDKVNQVNLLESLPYEAPEEVHADDLEVVDEKEVSTETKSKSSNTDSDSENSNLDSDDEGQITLF